MADNTIQAPLFSDTVDQSFFIEPLNGPQHPASLLDRFPDEVYDKSPDSHFVRFMYALLGPAGIGWLSKNYLDARLALYAHGFSNFDIEKFYGDPFSFGRILEEEFETDPVGLLPRDEWDKIRAQDEGYRQRAIAFFNAARLGTTPEGMALAARSGVDHAVEVVENYKYLFDLHSDTPLGLPYLGTTPATEEFIIIPRQEDSRSEIQTLSFEDTTIVAGTFSLAFRGQTTGALSFDASYLDVQNALRALGTIGDDGVEVRGGPNPNPFYVTFTGPLSNQDVPEITVNTALVDNEANIKQILVTTATGGISPVDEVVNIPDALLHNLETALDYLRPVGSFPTVTSGVGTKTRQIWKSILSSSSYTEVIRYVTGSNDIVWPDPDDINWVEADIENESRRVQGDLQHHYTAYLTPSGLVAYTDAALDDPNYAADSASVSAYDSTHVGRYDPDHVAAFPYLGSNTDDSLVYSASNALAPCADGVQVLTQEDSVDPTAGGIPLVNGILPIGTIDSEGIFHVHYQDQRRWSSLERRPPTADFLEIDLGETRVVNFVEFDIGQKPIAIDIYYDTRDHHPRREFRLVEEWPGHPFATEVAYDPHSPPWYHFQAFFKTRNGERNVYTRFLRIRFTRRSPNPLVDTDSALIDPVTNEPIAYSIDVRHLKIGRYAMPHGT